MTAKPKTPPSRDAVADALGLLADKIDGVDRRQTAATAALREEIAAVKRQQGVTDAKVDALAAKVGAVVSEVSSVVSEVRAVDAKVGAVDAKVDRVDAKVDALAADTNARFERLEAVMNENHLTLNRKLDLLLSAVFGKRED